MKKLLLIAVLVGATAGTVPELRERAAPVVVPVAKLAWRGGAAAVDLFANNIFRWSVQRELRSIAVELERYLVTGDALPAPAQFPNFLRRERIGGSIDPWGSEYYLDIGRDGIHVGSEGPDTTRGTADDLRVRVSRVRD